jgi:hypothetical protein
LSSLWEASKRENPDRLAIALYGEAYNNPDPIAPGILHQSPFAEAPAIIRDALRKVNSMAESTIHTDPVFNQLTLRIYELGDRVPWSDVGGHCNKISDVTG